MARGRMISKSLSTSEKFAALIPQAGDLAEFCQLIYPLIVAHTDDFGRIQGDPFTVKMMCFPASPRSVDEFARALAHLDSVGLIVRYEVATKRYIQIGNFDPHQLGLHKRTKSLFPDVPGNSGKVRKLPAQEKGTEGNRTEGKRTELNLTKEKILDPENKVASQVAASPKGPVPLKALPKNGNGHDSRSKRPIFSGQRLTVFEWFLDKAEQTLGTKLLNEFDIHEWFFTLDTSVAKTDVVIPQRDNGAWLTDQLLTEAARRGLPIAILPASNDKTSGNAEALKRFVERHS